MSHNKTWRNTLGPPYDTIPSNKEIGKERVESLCAVASESIAMTSNWAHWRLKSPASRLFTQAVIQGADQRKHQSSASLAFVLGIHRWPVNSPHKGPVTRKMFPFDDVINFRCVRARIIMQGWRFRFLWHECHGHKVWFIQGVTWI